MALVLDGTNGVSGVDGTASNPAIEGTDSNTGIFYPAADTVAIGTGGTERLRVDSAGNAGLAVTPSAWRSTSRAIQFGAGGFVEGRTDNAAVAEVGTNGYLDSTGTWRYLGTGTASLYTQAGGHYWYNAASGTAGNAITFTQAMTLDASGNLEVGNSAQANTTVNIRCINTGSPYGQLTFSRGTGGANGFVKYDQSAEAMLFGVAATERARITSGGDFLVGTTSAGDARLGVEKSINDHIARFNNTATSGSVYGPLIRYTGQAPNNTSSIFFVCSDTSVTRAEIRSNGGLANYSANNVNLSDRREKTNFAPAKNYLDVICAIPVQTFNYIDQNMEEDPGETLGVVAQDVQAVAPEMVMESNWGTKEEPKMRLSIYQTDLQYALMKCIQELNTKVEAQAAEIAALKGNA